MHWGGCYISILAEHPDAYGQKQTKAPFCRLAGDLKSARKLKITQCRKVATTKSATNTPLRSSLKQNPTQPGKIARNTSYGRACDKGSLHGFTAATIRLAKRGDQIHATGRDGGLRVDLPPTTQKCYRPTLTPVQHYAKAIQFRKFFAKPNINIA
jgi:hypothetical protein